MKRAIQHTASAAVLAVGSELSRRGYDVTLGNTRKVDAMCAVPDGKPFKIQVKGISSPNGFYIDRSFFEGPAQEELFLVVVLVPLKHNLPLRFFVLSHADAKLEFSRMPTHKRDGRPYNSGFGLNWGSIKPYEAKWDKLPPLNLPPSAFPLLTSELLEQQAQPKCQHANAPPRQVPGREVAGFQLAPCFPFATWNPPPSPPGSRKQGGIRPASSYHCNRSRMAGISVAHG
jgi:hypothetical protein